MATVQPALLARGLRRVALARGVRIFEFTSMTDLRLGPRDARVSPRGTVHRVRRIATQPIPEILKKLDLGGCVAVSDSRSLVNFSRSTVEGRMIWGVGGGAIPFAGTLGERFDDASPRQAEGESGDGALLPIARR